MKRRQFFISAGVGLSAMALPGGVFGRLETETEESFNRRMAWWREARFGMFIHWGVSAVAAGRWKDKTVPGPSEWIMNTARIPVADYEPLAPRFNPVKFDAGQWAGIARDAGMNYMVFTSKHHDGFCMFDSKLADWGIMDRTPFKRDVVKELSRACPKAGVKFGIYHSILDWHHPDQKKNFPRYLEYMKGQLKELLTGYGEFGSLFFDGEWIPEWNAGLGRELETYVRSFQPDVVINNRVGKRSRFGVMMGVVGKSGTGDYDTPENTIPKKLLPRDWETCMTFNDSWGYKIDDHNWKSSGELIGMLVDCVSLNGNFLLNVGPDAEGLIPEESVTRLREIGSWLGRNGESIYGAGSGPARGRGLRSTRKGNTVFLQLFNWPKQLTVKMKERVKRGYLLSDPARPELKFRQAGNELTIELPANRPEQSVSVAAVEI